MHIRQVRQLAPVLRPNICARPAPIAEKVKTRRICDIYSTDGLIDSIEVWQPKKATKQWPTWMLRTPVLLDRLMSRMGIRQKRGNAVYAPLLPLCLPLLVGRVTLFVGPPIFLAQLSKVA